MFSQISRTSSLATQILENIFGKKLKYIKSGILRKKSYMYMHCFFKFLAHVNPPIYSPTFKTENTKTLTYNYSFLIV